MNSLTIIDKIFKSELIGENASLRVVGTTSTPWFVGKDVAQILGYKNSRDALSRHVDDDDKTDLKNVLPQGVVIHDSFLNQPETTLINESGLYSLILRSTLPQAKQFKRWVTAEVLPSIRKTGVYEREMTELKEQLSTLQENYDRLVISSKRDPLRDKGDCLYIFDYAGLALNTCKIGITNNIKNRCAQHRTTIPMGNMVYAVYTEHCKVIEDALKVIYKEKINSEVIQNVPIPTVISSIVGVLTLLGCPHRIDRLEGEEEEEDGDEEIPSKKCGLCRVDKTLDCFWRDKTKTSGYNYRCIDCCKKRKGKGSK